MPGEGKEGQASGESTALDFMSRSLFTCLGLMQGLGAALLPGPHPTVLGN